MEYRLEYLPSDHTAKKVMFFLSISVLFSSANVQQKKIPRSSYIYLKKKKKKKISLVSVKVIKMKRVHD